MKIGRLTIIEELEPVIMPSKQKCRRVKAICDCGKEKIVYLNNIMSGRTISCGCFKKDFLKKYNTKETDKTIWIEYNNEIIKLSDFSRIVKIDYHFAKNRYNSGWDAEDIVEIPKEKK